MRECVRKEEVEEKISEISKEKKKRILTKCKAFIPTEFDALTFAFL